MEWNERGIEGEFVLQQRTHSLYTKHHKNTEWTNEKFRRRKWCVIRETLEEQWGQHYSITNRHSAYRQRLTHYRELFARCVLIKTSYWKILSWHYMFDLMPVSPQNGGAYIIHFHICQQGTNIHNGFDPNSKYIIHHVEERIALRGWSPA